MTANMERNVPPPGTVASTVLSTAELEAEASAVRTGLDLDALLATVGTPHLVGSAALGLMVWRDLDITVVCDRLAVDEVLGVVGALAAHRHVRQLTVRNDTGDWNVEPDRYPDGIYVGVDHRDGDRRWNIDIWFVTDAERQPDLRHLREVAPRLDGATRAAIIEIKRAWWARPEYGRTVTSWDIYV